MAHPYDLEYFEVGKNMKRRNVDCGKLRRTLKRTKITDGLYGRQVFKILQISYFLHMFCFVTNYNLGAKVDFVIESR